LFETSILNSLDDDDIVDSDFESTDEDDLIDEEEFNKKIRSREGVVDDEEEAVKKKVFVQ
jgi:hypothetical protein